METKQAQVTKHMERERESKTIHLHTSKRSSFSEFFPGHIIIISCTVVNPNPPFKEKKTSNPAKHAEW